MTVQPAWATAAFWLLVLASIAIAAYAFRTVSGPAQPRARQQLGVSLPDRVPCGGSKACGSCRRFTPTTEQPFGETGLAYWIGVMGKPAAIPLQADFVNNIVLPNFYLFAPIVYGLEVLTAVSLMLGSSCASGASSGHFRSLNLWLGLYSAPNEWPWTYFFLLLVMLIFAIHRYGRSLGLDAIITARSPVRSGRGRISSQQQRKGTSTRRHRPIDRPAIARLV